MKAESGKERKEKRRHKDPSERKVVKKLAKKEMSELLNLKKQLESEIKKEDHSRDCANPEKKAVTLKKTVRFFGK